MSATYRSDGLDNPLSLNGPGGVLTWDVVERAADESPAVESYDDADDGMAIEWCDGSSETFCSPNSALAAIRAMEAN